MDPRNLASTDLLAELLSSDGLNEVLAVLIAIAVAVIAGRIVRAAFKQRLQNPAEGLSARLIETLVIAAPYIVAAGATAIALAIVRRYGMSDNVLELAYTPCACSWAATAGSPNPRAA